MACPGSVRLASHLPEPPTSKYAEEGTRAHAVAEEVLTTGRWPDDVPEDMQAAVGVYVDYLARALAACGAQTFETRLDLSVIHPGMFGTADAVLLNGDLLTVVDYKHGAGVYVPVEDNPQILYYLLGAYYNLPPEERRGVTRCLAVIVQPRYPHSDGPIHEWEVSLSELLDFELKLHRAAKRTQSPDAPLVTGDHCRWCPAGGQCPEQRRIADETAKAGFLTNGVLDGEDLAVALGQCAVVETWAKQVREVAYELANGGAVIPGYKLVEKRATRQWADPETAAHDLQARGVDPDAVFQPAKVKTPAQIEKTVPKSAWPTIADLVVTTSSGTTLVPESDRRKAVLTLRAEDVFPALPEETV